MRSRPSVVLLSLAVGLGAAAAGCGDDDGRAAAATAEPLCAGIFQLDGLEGPGGPQDPTPEQLAAFADELRPLVGDIRSGLDGRLADEVAVLDQAVSSLAEGDATPLGDPAIEAALTAVRADAADVCGFGELEITARDFAFELPDPVDDGKTRVEVINEGAEPHVLLLMRRTDDTTTPTQELVDAYVASFDGGEPPAGVEPEPGGLFVVPGATGSIIWDFEPGTYVYFCPVPSGEDGSGPPHHSLGMLGEFTVID